jgi:hypothetical protein
MSHKDTIHRLLNAAASELLAFIRESEALYVAEDNWVPAMEIKNKLELNFVAVPRSNKQYGEKGWLFAILARMLEDQGLVEYQKVGARAYYRSARH